MKYRLFTATAIIAAAFFACSAALAQKPAPQQPAPQPPNAATAPADPLEKELDDWAKQAKTLREHLDSATTGLNEANVSIDKAEQYVDELLAETQALIDEGSDNGNFMKALRKSIEEAGTVAAQAKAGGRTETEQLAIKKQSELQGYATEMARIYGQAQKTLRALRDKKLEIADVRKLQKLTEAINIARQAVKEYGDFYNTISNFEKKLETRNRPGT